MERFYIYKLVFESGATYVGQHTQRTLNDDYVTSSSYFRRHPEDRLLKREILLDNLPDRERVNIMETICICADKAENPKNVNYNLGGWLAMNFGGWNEGIPASEEQKRKVSEKMKGRTPWNKGKKLSEEHKSNISKGSVHYGPNKGKTFSEDVRKKMSDSHKGKAHSEEWNKKVGLAHKGKPKPKESVEKMRQTKLGKKLSDENKKAISLGQMGLVWWTDGNVNKKSKECPGDEFKRGRSITPWNKK